MIFVVVFYVVCFCIVVFLIYVTFFVTLFWYDFRIMVNVLQGSLIMTQIISLNDGIDVEVELDDNVAREISYKDSVDSSIERIHELLSKIVKPISNTYSELSQSTEIESTKVAIGIKVGVEGNFILAKSSAGANIQVEMILKPRK